MREADARDLEAASDELRERTMSLEPPMGIAGKGAVAFLLSLAVAAMVVTFKFRIEIKSMLGLS